MRRSSWIAAGLVALVVLGSAFAEDAKPDPVKSAMDQIDKGKAALTAGDSQGAIDCLQKAIGFIQETLKKKLGAFLPAAPDGFTRGDISTDAGNWGSGAQSMQITTASVDYTRKSDSLVVHVELSNSPQIAQAIKAMIQTYDNPMVRKMFAANSEGKIESVSGGSFKGWLISQKGENSQVMAGGGNMTIKVEVEADNPALAKQFWDLIDKDGLSKVASGK